MENGNEHIDYKQAYEQEKARAASLAGRLADAKNEADNLQFQLMRQNGSRKQNLTAW